MRSYPQSARNLMATEHSADRRGADPREPFGNEPAHRGRWLVVAAAILWSSSGFFAKAPWWSEWPASDRGLMLAFWRAAAAGLLLLPGVRRPSWSPALVPAALSFTVMNAAFLMAMTLTNEGAALWLQYSAPLWVYLLGVGLLGEPATRRDTWMIAGVTCGVAVILCGAWRGGGMMPHQGVGAAWGLTSGLALAGVFLSLRRLSGLDPLWVVAVCHLTAAAALAPWVLTRYAWPSAGQLMWLVAFGAIQMGLPYVLFTRGLRTVPAHEASCLALLEPLLVSLWVYLAWGRSPDYRPPDTWTWAGGILILLGLLVRYSGRVSVRPPIRRRRDVDCS